MTVRRAALAAFVAVVAVLPSGAAHAGPCDDPPVPCPAEVRELVDAVEETLQNLCEVDLCVAPPWWLDPAVCPVLMTLSPGVPPVVVGVDGDVYVDGDRVHDCPPYDWP